VVTCSGTSQVHGEGLRHCEIDSVCQRSDDQSSTESNVLIAIVETSCNTWTNSVLTETEKYNFLIKKLMGTGTR
jgi:hypothetical protein